MIPEVLKPHVPLYDDELTQGYFARTGYFHAGVNAAKFCRYSGVGRFDFCRGTESFIEATVGMTGGLAEAIAANTLKVRSEKVLELRGETLGLPMVRRTFVRFCPLCLRADSKNSLGLGEASMRFRWAWLLRPVVICPEHGLVLTELPAKDTVKAFDIPKLLVDHEFSLPDTPVSGDAEPGVLQVYVTDRLAGIKGAAAWLDDQDIASGVKACEMLGALIHEGPSAQPSGYSEVEWAHVGNIGFQLCAQGADAILAFLAEQRISSGRISGRAGPQAAYGFFYRWLNKTQHPDDLGPLRQIVFDAIVDNFAIGAGERILGQVVRQRRTHSVNTLVDATGISRFGLYRLMRKAGMIPETAEKAAFNQWVFPAEKGEMLISRVENSVPLTQVRYTLGCSKTQAEQVAYHGLINSVVPISEGRVGLTKGYFNRDDLAAFLAELMRDLVACEAEEEGYRDLTAATRGRSSTVEVLRWQMDGKLFATRLIKGIQRIDHLRFDLEEIAALSRASTGLDVQSLKSVAQILRISHAAAKLLTSDMHDGPWLKAAPAETCAGLIGKIYVTNEEIDRFQQEYATSAIIARKTRTYARTVLRVLKSRGVHPAFDPLKIGAWIYRQKDVASFIEEHIGNTAADMPSERTKGLEGKA